jgi:HK97 family phage prohead protease
MGEDQSDFVERCVADDKVSSEFPDFDQRVAVCVSQYQEGSKMTDTNNDQHISDDEFDAEFLEEAKMQDGKLDVAFEYKAEDSEEEIGVFTGYGSIFGNKDLGNDVVVDGAFTKSIARKGAKAVKLLYQHRPDEPIGVFDEIVEDRRGLKVKGRLAMGTQRGREVYELMKMGALDGLSIGYRVDPRDVEYDEKGKRRLLKSVDLMEISAVTFPMNPRARVQAVKGAERTVREWEELLRDAGSLSRNEAKAAASAVAKALEQRDAVKDEKPEVLEAIKRFTNILKT